MTDYQNSMYRRHQLLRFHATAACMCISITSITKRHVKCKSKVFNVNKLDMFLFVALRTFTLCSDVQAQGSFSCHRPLVRLLLPAASGRVSPAQAIEANGF